FFGFTTRLVIFLFVAITFACVPADAADVIFYGVFKDQAFNQTSTGAPTPKGSPDRFDATVFLTTSNYMTSATVQPVPAGPVQSVQAKSDSLQLTLKFTTLNDLNTAFPNGNYQMVLNTTHDGTRTSTLPLTGDAYPGNDPHISNFDAAQLINPTNSFILTW